MTEVTGRVSNRAILSALEGLPAAIAAAMAPAQVSTPEVSVPTLPVDPTLQGETGEKVVTEIDPGYLAHVSGTLQDRANLNKATYMLYARRNKAGETKLAYCAADKWSSLTDRRIIGAVKTVSPE